MIVQLTGGLGNQMFCYAFGASMSKKRDEEVYFTRNHVDGNTHGGYGLGVFNIDPKFIDNVQAPFYQEPHFQFDPNAASAAPGTSFLGYWQTEKYFDRDVVRKSFILRYPPSDETLKIAEQMKKGPSAFIHVRRGDYLKEPHKSFHGNLDNDYYYRGVNEILDADADTQFFGFSDDPQWLRENFPKITVVDRPGAAYEDLWLMSRCKHGIVANSSFSWWGAWLGGENTDRVIVAPRRWFMTDIDTSDLVPERWTRI